MMKELSLPSWDFWKNYPPFYLIVLSLILAPFLYILFSFYGQMQELEDLEESLNALHQKQARMLLQKEKEAFYLNQIKSSDPHYIDKYLETLVFLEPEIKKLQGLCQGIEANDPMKKRLKFLKESNKPVFIEENIHRNDFMQEVEEKLKAPVELDDEDLKKVLSLIEGISTGPFMPKECPPHMLIKNFDLSKKKLSSQEEVFCMKLEFIKRESIK